MADTMRLLASVKPLAGHTIHGMAAGPTSTSVQKFYRASLFANRRRVVGTRARDFVARCSAVTPT